MSSEIVKYQWQDENLELTKDDVRNLISTSKEVTDKEVMLFLQLCKYQKLNPFVREAYLIKYGTSPARIVVGKEVFTKRAGLNKDFDGYDITDNWKANINLSDFEVTCKVYRKNLTHPITVTVSYPEYVGTDSAGNVNHMWKSKPRTMLRKVSLMQGLREAFPTDLGGLYEENELDQQTIPKDITPKEETENKLVEGISKQIEETASITKKEVIKEAIETPLDKHLHKEEPELITKEEVEEVFPEDFRPATEKQKDYIYGYDDGIQWLKGIVDSHLLKKAEVDQIGAKDRLDFDSASRFIGWWIGNKAKGIVGEREKRGLEEKKEASKVIPKSQKDILIDDIRDLTKSKKIPKLEIKKVAKLGQFDTLMSCNISELEIVLNYCKLYGKKIEKDIYLKDRGEMDGELNG